MLKKIYKGTLKRYYDNAIEAYEKCIGKEENSFLSEEIDIPVQNLRIENDSVLFKYIGMDDSYFVIEVKLRLMSGNFEIGYYILVLDEQHTHIDDVLFFR